MSFLKKFNVSVLIILGCISVGWANPSSPRFCFERNGVRFLEVFEKPEVILLESSKSVFISSFPQAYCSSIQIHNENIFWWSISANLLHQYNLGSRKDMVIGPTQDFSISPDGFWISFERNQEVILFDRSQKKEKIIFPVEKAGQEPSQNKSLDSFFGLIGWTPDSKFLLFGDLETDGSMPNPIQIFSIDNKILSTNLRLEKNENNYSYETTVSPSRYWVATSNYFIYGGGVSGEAASEEDLENYREKIKSDIFELRLFDIFSGRTIVLGSSVGKPFEPRWDSQNNLMFQSTKGEERIMEGEITKQLLSSSLIEKKILSEIEITEKWFPVRQ